MIQQVFSEVSLSENYSMNDQKMKCYEKFTCPEFGMACVLGKMVVDMVLMSVCVSLSRTSSVSQTHTWRSTGETMMILYSLCTEQR